MEAETTPRRVSRLRLYAPLAALLILAVGWSVAWLLIRDRVERGLDEWIAAENATGRRWSCPDREIGGYPFRIEITCSAFRVERREVVADLGRLHVATQVYEPSHFIAEVAGPLRISSGAGSAIASWRLLQASVISKRGEERLAVAVEEPTARIERAGFAPVELRSVRSEFHARPSPADRTTGDFAFSATRAVLPGLDALIGGAEPADLDIVLAVTRAYDLPGRPVLRELERWRTAGGQAELSRLSLRKGSRRIEASGTGHLDEAHRPAGTLQASAFGLEGLLGRLTGGRNGLAVGLLGALLGTPAEPPPAASDPSGSQLRPLPPVRLEGGRVFLGPLPLPTITVPPLY